MCSEYVSLNTHVKYAGYSYIIYSKQDNTAHMLMLRCSMYEIKLIYKNEPKTITLLESITYCATVELFLRGIDTCQMSATRIAFESDKERTLGILILSESADFTPVCV